MKLSDPNELPELESKSEIKERIAIFAESWAWAEKRINRINVVKGWASKERRDGELIALITSELSECLEALRRNNPKSKKIDISHAEEEMADAVIRIMDMAFAKGWNIPEAIFKKIEYNKTRPYKHGGKLF